MAIQASFTLAVEYKYSGRHAQLSVRLGRNTVCNTPEELWAALAEHSRLSRHCTLPEPLPPGASPDPLQAYLQAGGQIKSLPIGESRRAERIAQERAEAAARGRGTSPPTRPKKAPLGTLDLSDLGL